jgi:hypothetical protein
MKRISNVLWRGDAGIRGGNDPGASRCFTGPVSVRQRVVIGSILPVVLMSVVMLVARPASANIDRHPKRREPSLSAHQVNVCQSSCPENAGLPNSDREAVGHLAFDPRWKAAAGLAVDAGAVSFHGARGDAQPAARVASATPVVRGCQDGDEGSGAAARAGPGARLDPGLRRGGYPGHGDPAAGGDRYGRRWRAEHSGLGDGGE